MGKGPLNKQSMLYYFPKIPFMDMKVFWLWSNVPETTWCSL